MQTHSLRTILLLGLGALVFGFGAGVLLPELVFEKRCQDELLFVNESARCGRVPVIHKAGYSTLRSALHASIESWKDEGKVTHVSIYFRDLHNSGPTFSIEANTGFSPASLLKVPMALTYLRLSEEEYPNLLETKLIPLEEDVEFVQYFEPSKSARPGKTYSVSELLDFSLKYSDNTSYFALYDYLVDVLPPGEEELLRTFKELGILELEGGIENFISVREYSGLFRQLYNASYLSPELSHWVLSRLGGLRQGMRGAVPARIPVASKFGERGFDDGSKQLHDCGIVYYPDNPFILCIMTAGDDWDELSSVIRDITRMVYEEVDSRRIVLEE